MREQINDLRKERSAEPYVALCRRWFAFADWVERNLDDAPVALCVCHDSLALEAARRLQARTGCRLVYDAVEHPDYAGRPNRLAINLRNHPGTSDLLLAHERDVLRRAALILAGSPGVAAWYRREGIAGPIHVVRNCLDYAEAGRNLRIRRDCGAGPDDILLVYPNTATPDGGLDILVRSLTLLPDTVRLAVLGRIAPSDFANSIARLVADLGLEDRVRHPEAQPPEQLVSYRSGADLAVAPLSPDIDAHATCLPNRVFESIMSRLPIVCSDLPHVRALIARHDCGRWFAGHRAEALAAALQDAIADLPALRRNVDAAAGELNWSRERGRFVEAMATVLPDGGGRVVILANKSLATNQRVFRHARTLREMGHAVCVMAAEAPVPALQVPEIAYAAIYRVTAAGEREATDDDAAAAIPLAPGV